MIPGGGLIGIFAGQEQVGPVCLRGNGGIGVRVGGVDGQGQLRRGAGKLDRGAPAHYQQKFPGDHLAAGDPADKGGAFGGAVVPLLEQLIFPRQQAAQIRLRRLGLRLRRRGAHRHHPADALQFLIGIVQIHLILLDLQLLALQFQLGQAGIEAHEQVALLYLLPLLHQDLGDGLGVGQVDGLDLIGGDGAVALPGVAPVFGHAHKAEREHLHRGGAALAEILPPKEAAAAHHGHNGQNDQRFLKLSHVRFHLLLPAARRRECGRSCRRTPQWPAHG